MFEKLILENVKYMQNNLNKRSLYVDIGSTEEIEARRVVRILTTDFPQYFAVVTRYKKNFFDFYTTLDCDQIIKI